MFCATFFSCNIVEKNEVRVEKGIIDLRKFDFSSNQTISLNGQWEFYPHIFLSPNKPENDTIFPHYIEVPMAWNVAPQSPMPKAKGFATYRIKILIPHTKNQFGFKMQSFCSSYILFVNGKEITKDGIVGNCKKNYIPQWSPHAVDFSADADTLDIIIHVANFDHVQGGAWREIKFGSAKAIHELRERMLAFELLIFGALLIMFLYHLSLFLMRRKDKWYLYFAAFCFFMAFRTIITGNERYLIHLTNMRWDVSRLLSYILYYLLIATMGMFLNSLFKEEFKKWFLRYLQIAAVIYIALTIILPAAIYTQLLIGFHIVSLTFAVYAPYALFLSVRRKRQGSRTFLVGVMIMVIATVNDILFDQQIINTGNILPFGLFLFILLQAIMLAIRLTRAFFETEKLTVELDFYSKNLEKLVDIKTKSLQEANKNLTEKNIQITKQKEEIQEKNEELKQYQEEILTQRDEIENQRDFVIMQRDEISRQKEKMTDSIYYAKRIQNALLPLDDIFKMLVPKSFVLYRPKDIVSGDFYWIKQLRNFTVIAVADCTGHGVPGAFMSLLGISFLNELVVFSNNLSPADILVKLGEKVKKSLRQLNLHDSGPRDGMDIALCIIDLETYKMNFSGAYNPLYIIRHENETAIISDNVRRTAKNKAILYQLNADKMPIGIYLKEKENFTTHTVQLLANDTLYLFTDGYVDQFNSATGRKFLTSHFKETLLDIYNEPIENQEEILSEVLDNWKGSRAQIDDILILGFKIPF